MYRVDGGVDLKQMLEVSGEECPMIAIILLHWTLIVGRTKGPILGWTRTHTHCAVDVMHRKMSGLQLCLTLANRISEANLTV